MRLGVAALSPANMVNGHNLNINGPVISRMNTIIHLVSFSKINNINNTEIKLSLNSSAQNKHNFQ